MPACPATHHPCAVEVTSLRAAPPQVHTCVHACRMYDVKEGDGPEVVEGDRVVVHYEAKWKGITFVTSRVGAGVTGGEPYGFDVGATGSTRALRGLDLGVRGMQRGAVRKLIVPPELAYGERGTPPPSYQVDVCTCMH